jgi:hypothetical protein
MQKNNLETPDSSTQTPGIGMDETPSDWEFNGVTLFRALGYVVGLLSFMVGTAIFMLGFSLANETLVRVASFLYSLAIVSLAGRLVIERLKPKNEIQAVWVGVAMLCGGGLVYGGLTVLISVAGLL